MANRELLDRLPGFASLPETTLAAVAQAFDEVLVPAGERVASQGDFAYELFVVVEGKANVEQDGEVVAVLGPGDVFGEVGLLLTGRRTAAVVSETPMILLAMFDQTFRRVNREHPEFAELVYGETRGRLTSSSG